MRQTRIIALIVMSFAGNFKFAHGQAQAADGNNKTWTPYILVGVMFPTVNVELVNGGGDASTLEHAVSITAGAGVEYKKGSRYATSFEVTWRNYTSHTSFSPSPTAVNAVDFAFSRISVNILPTYYLTGATNVFVRAGASVGVNVNEKNHLIAYDLGLPSYSGDAITTSPPIPISLVGAVGMKLKQFSLEGRYYYQIPPSDGYWMSSFDVLVAYRFGGY